MIFANFRMGRIAVHEIFQRANDRTIQPPIFAENLSERRMRTSRRIACRLRQSSDFRLRGHDTQPHISSFQLKAESKDITMRIMSA
jgi:hypothetical protein